MLRRATLHDTSAERALRRMDGVPHSLCRDFISGSGTRERHLESTPTRHRGITPAQSTYRRFGGSAVVMTAARAMSATSAGFTPTGAPAWSKLPNRVTRSYGWIIAAIAATCSDGAFIYPSRRLAITPWNPPLG